MALLHHGFIWRYNVTNTGSGTFTISAEKEPAPKIDPKAAILEALDAGNSASLIADTAGVTMAAVLQLIQEPETTELCGQCGGTGKREEKSHTGDLLTIRCPLCRGEGWLRADG
jgi:hypothetical protein